MFRKSKKKLFSRRSRGSPSIKVDHSELQAEFAEAELAAYPDEPESSIVFRKEFIKMFNDFKHQSDLLVNGVADISDTWKDVIGAQGTALSAAVIAGIIGLLGGLMIISAGLTAGLSIGIAVLGVGIAVGYYKYREYVKQVRLDLATEAMDRDDFSGDVQEIARSLASLYRLQLESSTVKDAHNLAYASMQAISEEMQKNKKFAFDELMYPSSLQGVLVRAEKRLPKVGLDMNLMTTKKFNTRGMIRHTAFYCKETNEFYKTSKSKGRKYGVLYFNKKSDLDDYQAILSSSMKHADKWKLSKMRPHEVGVLKRGSIFKAYDNDKDFERRANMEVIENSNNLKVTP